MSVDVNTKNEVLNETFNTFCKPNYKSYKKITNHITLIDNFFENFEEARKFFTERDKWKTTSYQTHSKPGFESLFPNWVGVSLMEKYAIDNRMIQDLNSYSVLCNFFYDESDYILTLSNSNYFPHIDGVQDNGILKHICLINLNNTPVSTNFYCYKNQEYCTAELQPKWEKYNDNIENQLMNYYRKTNITRKELKLFLDQQDLDVKLDKEIKYNPNQAIIYSSNLFHCPNVTEEFTKNNPRSLLRISFDTKIKNDEIMK